MNMYAASLAALLTLAAASAHAEGEGNGAPFAYRAAPQMDRGAAFLVDMGQEAYPRLSGMATQPPSLAQLVPGYGSEAPVQTARSLPAVRGGEGRYLEAGVTHRWG